jgi:hypothetical protein
MRLLTVRNGGRREESEPEESKNDELPEMGIKDDISAKGIKTTVPLSKRIWYTGDPKESKDKRMSITVPARSI